MDVKRSFVLILALLLVVGLASCTRSLTTNGGTPPTSTPAPVSEGGGTPAAPGAPTSDVMAQLEMFGTQTAMATMGIPAGQPGGQTTPAPAGGVTPLAPGETAQAVPTLAEAPAESPTPAPPTATAAPAVVVPTATPGLPSTYTLENGEYIYCIARRFNINPSALLSASGLGANTTVYAGMTLNIPKNAAPFPGERSLRAHPTTYTVSGNESINSIACQFGDVDPNAIAFANSLSAPYKISSGQTLQIP